MASIKGAFTLFLPLINISEDYRRVFCVIPWVVLVTGYLFIGFPSWILGSMINLYGREVLDGFEYPKFWDHSDQCFLSKIFK